MLTIKNLRVSVEWKNILNTISTEFELGQNYCILWKNGSWKSSLAMTIMWHPKFVVEQWEILINKQNILTLWVHERAKLGIFLAFQAIPEIEGLKLFEFLRTIYANKIWKQVTFLKFRDKIKLLMDELSIDHDFLRRDLNVGFSGGERRKIEILQIKLLEPKYILLDEVDSWLDVDAFRSVADLLKSIDTKDNCFIIITHLFTILEYISVNKVLVMQWWKIIQEWGEDLAMNIKKNGFNTTESNTVSR